MGTGHEELATDGDRERLDDGKVDRHLDFLKVEEVGIAEEKAKPKTSEHCALHRVAGL